MDMVGHARRNRSQFRAWNSYLAKKAAAEAGEVAAGGGAVRAVVKLTSGLIDTYEGINRDYYERKKSREKKDRKEVWKRRSPLSVLYCDENHNYIVRPGETFNNRYMLEKVIGRGSFGQVVRAYDLREKTHVAIKIIKNNSLYVEQALSEVRMTSHLNRIDPEDEHAIMRLRDRFIFRGHQCLVLELLSFSLYDLLRSSEFYGVSLKLVRKFSRQILNCLAFLARDDVNIAHCDLKPENVLLRHPQHSAIKVVDFGASCRVSKAMFTYVQSRFYRAPEVILGLPYDTQVDVWSLGCMLVELFTGYPVFAGRDENDQMAIIVERLGMPPRHMLDDGKKTEKFFDRDPITGEWLLKTGLSREPKLVVPGSKPVKEFVEHYTGGGSGKRKRASSGHTVAEYEIFLSLSSTMLRYDPEDRITAEQALSDPFVTGEIVPGMISRSGRDSPPPPIPDMIDVGDNLSGELDPGRKAPVQRLRGGESEPVPIGPASGADDVSVPRLGGTSISSSDVGGKLRLSKSEPAFEKAAGRTFIFTTSDWAEEVGIEPPPWRAGRISSSFGAPDGELPASLGPAGGGTRLRRPRRVAERRSSSNSARSSDDFSFGIGGAPAAAAAIAAAGKETQRASRAHPAVPRGHGSALTRYAS